MILSELKELKQGTPSEFQVKTYGDWQDLKFPCADLEAIKELVSKYGKDGADSRLKFLGDLVRDNWGKGAFRNKDGSPSESLGPNSTDHKLQLGKFEVIDLSDDVLELKLNYDLLRKRRGETAFKSEKRGFTPVRIMPAA